MLNLGEVRATQVVATLVDGVLGCENRGDTIDNMYLLISMGYHNYYIQYMAGLGYHVKSNAKGAVIIEGVDGKEVD